MDAKPEAYDGGGAGNDDADGADAGRLFGLAPTLATRRVRRRKGA